MKYNLFEQKIPIFFMLTLKRVASVSTVFLIEDQWYKDVSSRFQQSLALSPIFSKKKKKFAKVPIKHQYGHVCLRAQCVSLHACVCSCDCSHHFNNQPHAETLRTCC